MVIAGKLTGSGDPRPTIAAVGLNPFRQQRKSLLDWALVAGFLVVVAVLVIWGFFG